MHLQRVWAAVRAADGNIVMAATALKMSTRDVLEVLLDTTSSGEHAVLRDGPSTSGMRRRFEIDPRRPPSADDRRSTVPPDERPAWTDDEEAPDEGSTD